MANVEHVRATFKAFREVFLPQVRIISKDAEGPIPLTLYRSQEFFLNKLQEGLENDIHFFVCLKARQLGISTSMLPLDLFWLYVNQGLQGALILDTGDNKETMRETITVMLDGLPQSFRVPVVSHNRNALAFKNSSRLQYMSAGHGRNSSLGRSRAVSFIHASEISSWGDQRGIDSLSAAMSQQNPNRLYVFESTALGQNVFFDMYQEAKDDPEKMAFFIGWWMKDEYALAPDSEAFDHFWGQHPAFTEHEQETGQFVLDHYGYEITPEQWAWYRRQAHNTSSKESLWSEYPSTEIEAWITTGSNFFNARKTNEDMMVVRQIAPYKAYDISHGTVFSSLRVDPVINAADCDLRVWEEPKPKGRYAIGMDVAYGLSAENDRTVIEVFRCFADAIVQVAEFATAKTETGPSAWMLCFLAGCYQDCRINVELNGPGMQVFTEMKYLRQQIRTGMIKDIPRGLNVSRTLDTMSWYLWHRPDTMGAGYAYGFKTAWDNKMSMLNGLRDSYNTGQFLPRSIPLLAEMSTLKQDGDSIAAAGRNKDDRVIATGLAHYAWVEWVRAEMMIQQRTFKNEMAVQAEREKSDKVIDHIVPAYFAELKAKRDAAAWARALSGDG